MGQEHGAATAALPRPVLLNLEAADGWLMLLDFREAHAELSQVPQEYSSHPTVLAMHWKVAESEGNCGQAWQAAVKLCQLLPDCASAWICQANSLRHLQGAQAAADLLLPQMDRFPDEPIMAYNLACYLTNLGAWADAWKWLAQALARSEESQLASFAWTDPDLQPLWDKAGEQLAITLCSSVQKQYLA